MTTNFSIKRSATWVVAAACLSVVFLGQGCVVGGKPKPVDAGVWKSADSGKTWVNMKNFVNGSRVTPAIASVSITTMTIDPEDHNTLYMGTKDSGFVYSYNGGESWQQPVGIQGDLKELVSGYVHAIAVHPKNKCIVYVAAGNKVFRTMNCMRDWTISYYESRNIPISVVALSQTDPNVVYMANTKGDIYRSDDAGQSWRVLFRTLNVAVNSIAFHPQNAQVIYVGTAGAGFWRSLDGGASFDQSNNGWKELGSRARNIFEVVADPVDPMVIYAVTDLGIVKSSDGGESWQMMNLTAPAGGLNIQSLIIDPADSKKLTFAGYNTLQSSIDGGTTWTPKKLPTMQQGSVLRVDPVDSRIMYLGTEILKK